MCSPDNCDLMQVSPDEVLYLIDSVDTEVQKYLKIEHGVRGMNMPGEDLYVITITEMESDDERILDIVDVYKDLAMKDYVDSDPFTINNHLGGMEWKIIVNKMTKEDLDELEELLEKIWSEREQLDHGWIA
jgi:hypothetical protein